MPDPQTDFLLQLRATFGVEAQEQWQNIVSDIVCLEQGDLIAAPDIVRRILGKLHTLKGASRAVNLGDMEMLCHAMESVFSTLRQTVGALSLEQFDILHQACNFARSLMQEPTGRIRNQAAVLIRQLNRIAAEQDASRGHTPAAAPPKPRTNDTRDMPAANAAAEDASFFGGAKAADTAPAARVVDKEETTDVAEIPGSIRVQSDYLNAIRHQAEEMLSVELGLQHQIAELLLLADELGAYHNAIVPTVGRTAAAPPSKRAASNPPQFADPARSQLERRCRRVAGAFAGTLNNFTKLRSSLLEAALQTALAPASSVLEPLPGMVRNLARRQGKEAAVTVRGAHYQIDRRVLDIVREALIHLVTNAVDHGIESPSQRVAAGKAPAGTVSIEIQHDGHNRVSIVVADDGMGIDCAALAAAAGSAAPQQHDNGSAPDEQQILRLALRSGVSTKKTVTPLSGRGVGLSIVSEKISLAGGELRIENTPGRGCSFHLTLPVRLATLRGLVLEVTEATYFCPLSSIDSVRLLREGDIGAVNNREALLAGNDIIPVVRLRRLLSAGRAGASAGGDEKVAVIARAAGRRFALLVDRVISEQEVLPRTLGRLLRRVRYISGSARLGDDRLALIIALDDIAKYDPANGVSGAQASEAPGETGAPRRVLVAEDSITSRLLLKHILETAGYHVETAVDGLDALSKLRRQQFDALVTDIEMPRLDGLTLTAQVRAATQTTELPVVLVTSLQSPEEKERGLRAGADAYVVKGSFDQDNLLATIRRLT